jgi:hypothetical protein
MLRRCSMIALALPSRSVETTKAPIFSASPAVPPAGTRALVSSKSRVAAVPGVTFTVATAV